MAVHRTSLFYPICRTQEQAIGATAENAHFVPRPASCVFKRSEAKVPFGKGIRIRSAMTDSATWAALQRSYCRRRDTMLRERRWKSQGLHCPAMCEFRHGAANGMKAPCPCPQVALIGQSYPRLALFICSAKRASLASSSFPNQSVRNRPGLPIRPHSRIKPQSPKRPLTISRR